MAGAGGGVILLACDVDDIFDCVMGKPGPVILNARIQEMDAVLAGIIEECTFDVTLDVIEDQATGDATFNLSDCVVEQESIALALATLSANHFNFVFPDLPQGDYAVIGVFATAAAAAAVENECPPESDFCDPGDGDAAAISHAFIGKTMMTVQEVRAVKGSLGGMDFIDIP